MRSGRLLLAGDAAHTVPPTGAKGLNLALADTRVLAEVVERAIDRATSTLLDAYTDRALQRVWKAQHFSYWMTTMLHGRQAATDFDELASSASSPAWSRPRPVPPTSRRDTPDGRPADRADSPRTPSTAEMQVISVSYAAGSGRRDAAAARLRAVPLLAGCATRTKDLHQADPEGIELWAPVFGARDVGELESDLTIQHGGEPVGERMVVTGRVLDGEGRPVRHQLVEIWQANAGGRYIHQRDQHPAPLDPHFTGMGRCLTDADGTYRFTTIKPGPYPWKNHHNAWRPAHIHFSLFGTDFTQRMVTQMYFPGDPLFALDPIYQSIADPRARERLVATYDHDVTQHEWATGLPLGHRADR